MSHVLPFLAALACFAIATFALVSNRTALATSLPLLCFVGGFYLLALLLAIPANMKAAGQQCTDWYRSWKGTSPPSGD